MLSPGQRAPPSIGFYSRPLGAPDLRLCARRIAFTQPVPIYSNSAVEKTISEKATSWRLSGKTNLSTQLQVRWVEDISRIPDGMRAIVFAKRLQR